MSRSRPPPECPRRGTPPAPRPRHARLRRRTGRPSSRNNAATTASSRAATSYVPAAIAWRTAQTRSGDARRDPGRRRAPGRGRRRRSTRRWKLCQPPINGPTPATFPRARPASGRVARGWPTQPPALFYRRPRRAHFSCAGLATSGRARTEPPGCGPARSDNAQRSQYAVRFDRRPDRDRRPPTSPPRHQGLGSAAAVSGDPCRA